VLDLLYGQIRQRATFDTFGTFDSCLRQVPTLLPPATHAVGAARRSEHLGSFGAEHAGPDNMHTLAAVIEAPARRADSAIRTLALWNTSRAA
jgi:hypothetical protein